MKKNFEQPRLRVERFQLTDAVMLSGWMQFDDTRTFEHFNGFIINNDKDDTRLG